MARKSMGKITTGEMVLGAVALLGIGYVLMHKTTVVTPPPPPPGYMPIAYTAPQNPTNTAISQAGGVLNNLINSIFT